MSVTSFDAELKLAIYRHTASTTRPPSIAEMAGAVGRSVSEVRSAYQRLYASRVLVLEEDGATIRMAPPFSGVATEHEVLVSGKRYYANCAWDSFGILAALGTDGTVRSRCAQSLQPIELRIRGGKVGGDPCVAHYAVPAAHWWDDIVHT